MKVATTITLTARQERFVDEYLVDLNATQAAIRAGYSARSAHVEGSRLLTNAEVAAAISAAKRERSEATKIDAEYVLRKLHQIVERCLQEVKPALHAKTRLPMKDKEGNALYTFNAAGANQALALLGKHVDIRAFEDRVHHDLDDGVVEILQAARRRAGRLTIDANFEPVDERLEATRRRVARPRPGCGTLVEIAPKPTPEPESDR